MQKLSHQELITRQQNQNPSTLPFVAVLNNVRSLYNVGSIFRTADGVGISKLYLCGITGHPPDLKISKTALGAEGRVSWEHSWDIVSIIRRLREENYQIILLEQMKESIPYQTFEPKFPVCLIIGNEISGISEQILSFCDASVEIEMAGHKNSLNVTVAFGIAAYYIRSSFSHQHVGS
ncbi:MAG: RNA methyltransferase [Candidatus Omnitrophica bacterium]|nr:RNA methyltransferase [Candidatus Omnitrophota bacterium]